MSRKLLLSRTQNYENEARKVLCIGTNIDFAIPEYRHPTLLIYHNHSRPAGGIAEA
jgi:hypothetical protein